jgi:hypothetical protein
MLFRLIAAVSGELRPEYRHFSQLVSELGETGSRTGALMNLAGFLPAAILVFLASLAFFDRFRGIWTGTLGSLCLSVFAVGMFAAGLFPCDVSCTPETPSRSQRLHEAASMLSDPALVLAPLLLAFRFRRIEGRHSMSSNSVATSILSFCALLATGWSLAERSGTGLFQRLYLGPPFLWLAIVSWRLWRSEDDREVAAPDA